MKPRLIVCLVFTAVATGLVASTDEEDLRLLSDDFDVAVAQQDVAAVSRLLSEQYVYTEPDSLKREENDSLDARAKYRLSRDQCWSDVAPSVRVTGNTAIVTGWYRVLDPCGVPKASATGWFTSTWVKADSGWKLLAEHRSRNVTTTITHKPPSQPSSTRQEPKAVAKIVPPEAGAGAIHANHGGAPKLADAKPDASGQPVSPATNANMRKEQTVRYGALPVSATNIFRAYEPNSVGYTYDEDDDPFLDFTFSAMFPLPIPGFLPYQPYPPPMRRLTETKFSHIDPEKGSSVHYGKPSLYFAATMRAGQYIGTRPSSPVVAKRFNPLLSLRFWAEKKVGNISCGPESEDNFFEIYYAHESNGQFIASHDRFLQQRRVYLEQELSTAHPDDPATALRNAHRSARDNISRGWDFIGMQFARDWDATLPWLGSRAVTMGVHAKFNYYLKEGLLQGDAEEYNEWEHDPEGKPRKQVDGISLRYTIVVAPPPDDDGSVKGYQKYFRWERRYAFTWTTGYDQPFRYNTLKAEGSVLLFDKLPLTVWGRYGYNSDLVDYYRKDYSVGIALTFWDY